MPLPRLAASVTNPALTQSWPAGGAASLGLGVRRHLTITVTPCLILAKFVVWPGNHTGRRK